MAFDFGEFFSRIITPPGSGGAAAQAEMRQAEAERAQAEALGVQKLALEGQLEAKRRAEFAAIPAADKESTRLASEAQMRKLLRASGFNFSGSPLGAAPLGFSTLLGE